MNKSLRTCEQPVNNTITHTAPIRVRYAETDAMGVVHHMHYITWFEVVRIQFFDDVGIPYKHLEELGYYSPVTEVQIKYHKPAFFDDRLIVKATMKDPVRVRFYVHYEVMRGEELLATGRTEHVFVNKQRNLVKPPKIFHDILNQKLNM